MYSPDTHSRAEKEGRSAHHIAHDLEVAQGRNLIDAVAQTTTSLSHFIISTLNGSKQWSKGKILHNLHFDTKALQINYLREKYPELWAKTSRLNLGVFMSNWKIEGAHAPTKISEGVYRTRMAMSGDRKLPMVDVRDTGNFFFVKYFPSSPRQEFAKQGQRLMPQLQELLFMHLSRALLASTFRVPAR